MKRGQLLILTGASSVGKGAIKEVLVDDKELQLFASISMTTRPKREGEEDGKDYYFVDYSSFAQAVRNHDLLEFTEFDGYYYGTPKNHIEFLLNSGKNVLVEVEAQGVGQIKLHYGDALAVFVQPETMEELEKQIRIRYKDDEASAQRRISKASVEMEMLDLFQHKVTNIDAAAAAGQIKTWFLAKLAK